MVLMGLIDYEAYSPISPIHADSRGDLTISSRRLERREWWLNGRKSASEIQRDLIWRGLLLVFRGFD